MQGIKTSNEYARLLKDYARIPKAVIAAVAVSALNITFCEDDLSKVDAAFMEEWLTLHEAGIIEQKPFLARKEGK